MEKMNKFKLGSKKFIVNKNLYVEDNKTHCPHRYTCAISKWYTYIHIYVCVCVCVCVCIIMSKHIRFAHNYASLQDLIPWQSLKFG